MIKLFGKTDKDFSSNGDKIIRPIKARVHKEDRGSFYLDIETDLTYIDDLVAGNILVANTPQGDQAFRIANPQRTKNKISLRAKHVYYDSENYLIRDSYVVDKDCNGALDHLNSATEPLSEYKTISDITTINSFRCVRKSLADAIETVLERWGGHLVRDNFTIGIRSSIGTDNGVTVRYGKNIKDITCTENWDEVVTKLMPVGKEGLLLPELYVESEQQYEIPYTKSISFEQNDVLEEDYIDDEGNLDQEAYTNALIADLRQQAQEYVDANSVPQVNYTLKANLEKVTDIGDTVQVTDERLGIDLLTNVISYEYDCILKRYIELEFGNFKQSLSGLIPSLTATAERMVKESTQTLQVTLGKELEEATSKIWSALGNSYIIYDGDKILVLDSIPPETAHNVIMINSGGIGFSKTGISGTFNSAWSIDGTMDMEQINVINLTANLIKGGTLKLGSMDNQSGILEVYDEANNLIAILDKNGLKVYGQDGSYVMLNAEVGFAGYDAEDNKIYWVAENEFHMRKSVVEEEITLCNKVRFIPITIMDGSTMVNDGIGLVSSN